MLTKKFKQQFHKDWLSELDKSEAKQDRKFYSYLKNQNRQLIDEYQQTRKMPNPQTYFKESELTTLYVELYKEIGFRFAKWYSLNFEKYIKKDFHNDYEDIWNEKFAYIGSQVAGERVVSISGSHCLN